MVELLTRRGWKFYLLVGGLLLAFTLLPTLRETLTSENLLRHYDLLRQWLTVHPLLTTVSYLLVYVAFAGTAIPGVIPLTILAGSLYGWFWGCGLVLVASTFSAWCGFYLGRGLLRRAVERRFPNHLLALNSGMRNQGLFYLFTLRLVPILPFAIVNLLMGVTQIRPWQFFVVGQGGMIPAIAVYVYCGSTLQHIHAQNELVPLEMTVSLVALGLLPLVSRQVWRLNRRKRIEKRRKMRSANASLREIEARRIG